MLVELEAKARLILDKPLDGETELLLLYIYLGLLFWRRPVLHEEVGPHDLHRRLFLLFEVAALELDLVVIEAEERHLNSIIKMGCCFHPLAPSPSPPPDYASIEERNIGLNSIPLEGLLATLRSSSVLDPITPNKLKMVFQAGRWNRALEGDSMAMYILDHYSIQPSPGVIHRHAVIALALLYAKASINQKTMVFVV